VPLGEDANVGVVAQGAVREIKVVRKRPWIGRAEKSKVNGT